MVALTIGRQLLSFSRPHNVRIVRSILSSSYFCHEEWNSRLQEPVFAGINADEFFFKMQERVKSKVPIEPIDVDIFANVAGADNLDECVYFLTLLRENRRTAFTLDSTHHAVCRTFLKENLADKLIPLLNDRVKYGLFPDRFTYNMLMDHFIERSDFANACRIANLYMLQEDFNPISNVLALHSVYGCLTDEGQREKLCSSEEREANKEEKQQEDSNQGDEEDTEYVRVPFVRNPHFDDHFDLQDPLQLSGKTLYLIGLRNDNTIGHTSQLVGLALWRKWTKAEQLLKKFSLNPSKYSLAQGAKELIDLAIGSLPESDESANAFSEKFTAKQDSLVGKMNVNDLVKQELTIISPLEAADCIEMKNHFSQWSKNRADALREQMEKYMREEKIQEIKKLREDLASKERKLYFFENFDKIEMEHKEAERRVEELKSSETVEEYFPPLINRE